MKSLIRVQVYLSIILLVTTAFAQDKVVVIPMGGQKGTVAKTGQTLCYNESGGVIDCIGTGQDGELQMGFSVTPRFMDNGNGTVTDRLTGLIWLKDGNCVDFFSNDNTGQNKRNWEAALDAANKLSSGRCGLTDGSVAGDWRLPNRRELLSLMDYSRITPALPSGHPFTKIQSDYYWSSTYHAAGTDVAWRIDFNHGGDGNSYKTDIWYVITVRGGQ